MAGIYSVDNATETDNYGVCAIINRMVYTGTGKTLRIAKAQLIKSYRASNKYNKIKVEWK